MCAYSYSFMDVIKVLTYKFKYFFGENRNVVLAVDDELQINETSTNIMAVF